MCSAFFFFSFFLIFVYLCMFGHGGSALLRRLFSSCVKQSLLSSCGAQASHCEEASHCENFSSFRSQA